MGTDTTKESSFMGGKIKFAINKDYYFESQIIEGEIYLDINQNIIITDIKLSLKKIECFLYKETEKNISTEIKNEIIKEQNIYINQYLGIQSDKITLNQGSYKFPFKFTLPPNLHPSFEYPSQTKSAYIRYILIAELISPTIKALASKYILLKSRPIVIEHNIRNDDEKAEGDFVTEEIKKLVKDKNISYDDIAILYRTNAQSRSIEESMLKANIPYKIIGSFYFYNRKEIKDLLCYLRLINNPNDDTSLTRIINVPKRGIGDKTIGNITAKAEENNTSMFEAITSGKELAFKEIILSLQESCKNLSLTEMVEEVLEKSGIKKELKESKLLENEIRLENLEEFKSITKNYEEEFGEISLDDFLNEISLVSDVTEHTDGSNKVSLMTIHSVKGLEFDYVFVIGMEEGLFPHYNSINEGTNEAIEEERRLCYVAITRAKKKLWIINCKKRLLYGQTQVNAPSRFIDEIDKRYLETENKTTSLFGKISKFRKENMLNNNGANYAIGDNVRHIDYGEGVVVNIDKSLITIAFPHPIGTKKIIKNHRSITKI